MPTLVALTYHEPRSFGGDPKLTPQSPLGPVAVAMLPARWLFTATRFPAAGLPLPCVRRPPTEIGGFVFNLTESGDAYIVIGMSIASFRDSPLPCPAG